MALEVNSGNFEEVTGSDKLVVLDFWASWCGPCRTIGPIIDELAKEFSNEVVIGKVNVDDNNDIAAKYGVRNIPTIVFLKGGQVVEKVVGVANKAKFTELIDKLK